MATDKTTYWLDIADYDLDTAEALKPTGALPVTMIHPTRTTTNGWPTVADSTNN